MTDLEAAQFLAIKQITERWTQDLTYEEKWELYRYIIRELQRMLPEEQEKEKNNDQLYEALARAHECCRGCID